MVETFSGIHSGDNANSIIAYSGNETPALQQAPTQAPSAARSVAVASTGACHPMYAVTILRLPDVIKRVGLKRASIYQHIADGTFPQQIPLGSRAVGWLEHEIDAWLAAQIARRTRS